MLERRLSLLQAVSLNMSMMVGIGPFITIPALVATLGGPQAMIGWILGALVALADGMVWSELAAAFPGSGGTYHFYDAAYGESRVGRSAQVPVRLAVLLQRSARGGDGRDRLAQYLGYFFPSWPSPPGTGDSSSLRSSGTSPGAQVAAMGSWRSSRSWPIGGSPWRAG